MYKIKNTAISASGTWKSFTPKQKEKKETAYSDLHSFYQNTRLMRSMLAWEKSLANGIHAINSLPLLRFNTDKAVWRKIAETFGISDQDTEATVIKEKLLESVGDDDQPRLSKALDAVENFNLLMYPNYYRSYTQALCSLSTGSPKAMPECPLIARDPTLSMWCRDNKKLLQELRVAFTQLKTALSKRTVLVSSHPLTSSLQSRVRWQTERAASEQNQVITPDWFTKHHAQVEGSTMEGVSFGVEGP